MLIREVQAAYSDRARRAPQILVVTSSKRDRRFTCCRQECCSDPPIALPADNPTPAPVRRGRGAEHTQSGLRDRFVEHRKRPLVEHLADWRAALAAKGNTGKRADLMRQRVQRLFDDCRFEHWPDLSASRVAERLAELRQPTDKRAGLSIQSTNYYLQAAKQFCRWMVLDLRAPESPLAHLQRGNAGTDRPRSRKTRPGTRISA